METDCTPVAATYRLQFHHGFRFMAAQTIVPYLHDLGISRVYTSPLFKARQRSLHGYSVTSPLEINPELGSRASFNVFLKALHSRGLDLLLDIVPNHMALSQDNHWWLEVLENGSGSPYAPFFDIDWQPANRLLTGKVLLPILGDPYGKVLENQELRLSLGEKGFSVQYYEHKFPLDPKTYPLILTPCLDVLIRQLGDYDPALISLKEMISSLENLPPRDSSSPHRLRERLRQKESLKKQLWLLYQENHAIHKFIDEIITSINGRPGEPDSFNLLDRLLSLQPYRLAYWRVALNMINYRRFFSVNDLIGLRIENPRVFEATHALLFELIDKNKVAGLRIDHIDGLYNPLEYLQRLRKRLARGNIAPSNKKNFYLVVEKILGPDESLPQEWPVAGTTGYDFLDKVNGLFVDPQGVESLKQIYAGFIQSEMLLDDVIYDKKKLVMKSLFAGEVESLLEHFTLLAAQDRWARDLSRDDLHQALSEFIVCLPVYRTYISDLEISPQDQIYIKSCLAEVHRRNPDLEPWALDYLKRVFLLEFPSLGSEALKDDWLKFIMRCQQFTGPIMAKGMEDTALYVYNPLVSLNEVGGSLKAISPEDFHRFNHKKVTCWPLSMNATSTHDTKRGEDVRMRLNVLSELPQLWEECLNRWSRWNLTKKPMVQGMPVPDPNQECFIYQTLLGVWPLSEQEIPELKKRVAAYIIKAAREAKVYTRWIATNPEYEQALIAFIHAILEEGADNEFLLDLKKVQSRLAYWGALNSLSQVLLKITSPGIPDFYQGTELWDFTLVDPDNRRPVDFSRRAQLLSSLNKEVTQDDDLSMHNLLDHWQNGAIKLYITYKALNFRRGNPHLFSQGEYIPLSIQGDRQEHFIAFARRHEKSWALTIAARFFAKINFSAASHVNQDCWPGSFLSLPPEAPKEWQNILTGQKLTSCGDQSTQVLPLSRVMQSLPVVLLFNCNHTA